MIYENTFEA
jgi:hypothetical protein